MTPVKIIKLGLVDYQQAWQAMRSFNAAQNEDSVDEIWLMQHPSVYTHGLNSRDKTVHSDSNIPTVQCDRGGETTYHGPGQHIAYILMNLTRKQWGVRQLVDALEQSVMDLLAEYGIKGERQPNAPGVYVNEQKIAALGLRIKRGYSYHGIALNAAMDLRPFHNINPCGYPGLQVTQLADLINNYDDSKAFPQFVTALVNNLGYNRVINETRSLATVMAHHG